MKRIRNKKLFIVLIVIGLFLLIDGVILSPEAAKKTNEKAETLNAYIDKYMPVYSGSSTKSFPGLSSGYFYKLELEEAADLKLKPIDISKDKFLGFGKNSTKLKVVCYIDDPRYKNKGIFSELVAIKSLAPGVKKITVPGKGDLKKYKMDITLRIEERDMKIKIDRVGWLWDTYAPAKIYYVTMDVKKFAW